jgi:ribosomal-protein-alanine N-acetyltransferase
MPAERGRVTVRRVREDDEAAFLAAVRASRALHGRWVSPPSTPEQFRAHVRRMNEAAHCGLVVCLRDRGDDGEPGAESLVGVVNLTQIVLGPFRSAYTGYYVFAGHERQGRMRLGLAAAVRHAFTVLRLHRLEANIQPDNLASIALARACGFEREGYSPRYLKIGGRWRDHERWALLADRRLAGGRGQEQR